MTATPPPFGSDEPRRDEPSDGAAPQTPPSADGSGSALPPYDQPGYDQPGYGQSTNGGQFGEQGPGRQGQYGEQAQGYGQPQYNQTEYGAPQHTQNPYGGPQYNADPYGDHQHSQDQYGSAAYSQNQYTQPNPGYGTGAPVYNGYGQTQAYGQAPTRNGLGIAALVVGILAFLVSWIPFIGILGIIGGIAAVVLGILGMREVQRGRANNRALSLTGLVIGGLALLIGIGSTVIGALVVGELGTAVEQCVQYADDPDLLEQCLQQQG